MSEENPATPHGTPPVPAPFKPALAPGVKSRIRLSSAPQPAALGLAAVPATFKSGVRPPLGAPKSRQRAIEPQPTPGAASYKVSALAPTQSGETIPVAHLVGSGLAAGIAVAAAVLLFLKF